MSLFLPEQNKNSNKQSEGEIFFGWQNFLYLLKVYQIVSDFSIS
jgi:hypothetical protein